MSSKRLAKELDDLKQEEDEQERRSLDSAEPGIQKKRKPNTQAAIKKLQTSLLRLAEQQEQLVNQLTAQKNTPNSKHTNATTLEEEEKEHDSSVVSIETQEEPITTWKDIKQFNGCVESLTKAPLTAIRAEEHPYHIIRTVASVCDILEQSEQFKTLTQKQLAFKCLWNHLKGAVDTSLGELMGHIKPPPVEKLDIIKHMAVLQLGESPTRSALIARLKTMKMSKRDSLESWKNTLAQLRITLQGVYPEHAPLEQDIAKQFADGLDMSMKEYAKAEGVRFTAATLKGAYNKAVEELQSCEYTTWLDEKKRNTLLPSGNLAAATHREESKKCTFCHRGGHLESECRTRQRASTEAQNKRDGEKDGYRTGRSGFRGSYRGRGGPPGARESRGRGGYPSRGRDYGRFNSDRRDGHRRDTRPPRHEDRGNSYRHPQEGDLCHRCGKTGHRIRDCRSTYHISGERIHNKGAWKSPHQAPARGYAATGERDRDDTPALEKPKNG